MFLRRLSAAVLVVAATWLTLSLSAPSQGTVTALDLIGVQVPAPRLHRFPCTGIGAPERNQEWVMPGKCFRLDDYKFNPLVSINHALDVTMIVGEVVHFEIIDGWLYADVDFIDRPVDWEGPWLPDLAECLLDAGVLGVSIMADQVEGHTPTVEEGIRYPGASYIVDSCRLLDLSVVAIPAFAEAVPVQRL